jgi:PAS domain S-box-containing protein
MLTTKWFVTSKSYGAIMVGAISLIGLWVTSFQSYLLFHILAELFSIIVACGIFMVAWNCRRLAKNEGLLFIGIAYLFIAALDVSHMLTYRGMGVFSGSNANISTQLWIATRYLESGSLLILVLLSGRSFKVPIVFVAYSLMISVVWASVFYWPIFPACFVEGVGLTAFKVGSEYVIILLLLCSAAALYKRREMFAPNIMWLLMASIVVTVASELAFTLYSDPYGSANLAGHYLKIVSFYLLYRAIIQTGLMQPFALVLRDLKKSEASLKATNENLEEAVRFRTAELIQVNESLTQSEAKYRNLVENSTVGVFSTGRKDGKYYFVNDALARMYGFDSSKQMLDEVTDTCWSDPKQRERMLNELEEHGRVTNFEAKIIVRAGRHIHVLFSAQMHGDTISGMAMDITEHKRDEERIKGLAHIFETSMNEIYIIDAETYKFVQVNEGARQNMGYSIEEFRELTPVDIKPEFSIEAFVELVEPLVTHEENIAKFESVHKRKDGSLYPVEIHLQLSRLEGRSAFVAIVLDITERKRAESILRKTENEKALILDSTSEKIAYHDLDQNIQWVNKAFLKSTDVSFSELKGQKCYHAWGLDRSCVDCPLEKAIETGEPQEIELTPGNQAHWPSTHGCWMVRAAPVRDGSGRIIGAIEVAYDITERKKTEAQIQQYQQRLKALASQLTLAEEHQRRRIAEDLHDHIGQSLAFARLRIAVAQRTTSRTKLAGILEEISDSLLQAVRDTRHLISDLSSPSMNEIGLAAAIAEWLEEQIENRHGLETEFSDQCGKLPLNDDVRAILFRSVRELMVNVIKHAQATRISVSLSKIDHQLMISVEDDGVGYDFSKAFDTAKMQGGFGLFSIQERMADLGGGFKVNSEPGKGCRVELMVTLES